MNTVRRVFATKEDLTPGLQVIEAAMPLKYVQCGWLETPELDVYFSALDIPDIGQEQGELVVEARRFLVLPASNQITVRSIPQIDGDVYYAADYGDHPDAIEFRPGGFYDQSRLVTGSISTSGLSEASISLYRSFARTVTKGFKRIGVWWLGPEAIQCANKNVRLITFDVNESNTDDLKPLK